MIYAQAKLANGVSGGELAALPQAVTRHDPPLVTQILARHHGNIVNIARTVFAQGEYREVHANDNVDELLVALEGTLHVVAGEETLALSAAEGGYAFIPYGVTAGQENRGDVPAAILSIAIRNDQFIHLNEHL